MKKLKDKILTEGKALNEHVLKVDSFLNHQVDANLMAEMAEAIYQKFKNLEIDKVVTIESSGIAPAIYCAQRFNVPLVIIKKQVSLILDDKVYQSEVISFTKQKTYKITVSKEFLKPNEKILIVDDFLANGQAALGVYDLVCQAGAITKAFAMIIEKSFQDGRAKLESLNIPIYSLARIKRLAPSQIEFLEEEI